MKPPRGTFTVEWECPDCGETVCVTVKPYVPEILGRERGECQPPEEQEIHPEYCQCGWRIDIDNEI